MHTVWMHIVQFHWNLCINVKHLHLCNLVYLLASFIQYERIAEDMSLMFFHLLVTLSQDPGQTWPMTDEGVVWHISHMHTRTHQQSVVFIRALQEFDYNQKALHFWQFQDWPPLSVLPRDNRRCHPVHFPQMPGNLCFCGHTEERCRLGLLMYTHVKALVMFYSLSTHS